MVHRASGPEVVASWHQDIYLQFRFSSEAALLLIREQGLDSPKRLRVLIDKNVNDICNVMMKPGSKNTNGTPNREKKVSAIVPENLKLDISLFYHW